MAVMDKEQAEELRTRLLEQRELMASSLKSHDRGMGLGEMREFRDPQDQAAAIASMWVTDRIAGDEGNLVEKIDLALVRLEEGTHGVCEGCGGEIPVARLFAKPSASLCVLCQERKDVETRR
ncbi:MAG: TraR/DksA family transcriptional regulator [Verrucomicrobiota bacterium]